MGGHASFLRIVHDEGTLAALFRVNTRIDSIQMSYTSRPTTWEPVFSPSVRFESGIKGIQSMGPLALTTSQREPGDQSVCFCQAPDYDKAMSLFFLRSMIRVSPWISGERPGARTLTKQPARNESVFLITFFAQVFGMHIGRRRARPVHNPSSFPRSPSVLTQHIGTGNPFCLARRAKGPTS